MAPALPAPGSGPGSGLLAGLLLLLGACAPFHRPDRAQAPDAAPIPAADRVDLRLIVLIHGDADYTYHDAAGVRLHADQEALRQAGEAGTRATHAEVFVFHQRSNKVGMFRGRRDGDFYHYRSGTLVRRENYSRESAGPELEAEAALLRRHAATGSAPARRVLVYFGHEIPVRDRAGYSASRPGKPFSVPRFARGLEKLAPRSPVLSGDRNGKPYGLVILSTCYGGTPAMMEALAPLTDYAVASPAYLHLSFLDMRALGDFAPPDSIPVRALADTVARQSFERLKTTTQTEITVAVYDLKEAMPFLVSHAARTQGNVMGSAWRDCATDPAFGAEEAARGVTLYHRAPRFGPGKNAAARSGWQCRD